MRIIEIVDVEDQLLQLLSAHTNIDIRAQELSTLDPDSKVDLIIYLKSRSDIENINNIIIKSPNRNIIVIISAFNIIYALYFPKSTSRPCLNCLLLKLKDNNPEHNLLLFLKYGTLPSKHFNLDNRLKSNLILFNEKLDPKVEEYSIEGVNTTNFTFHFSCSCENSGYDMSERMADILLGEGKKISPKNYRLKKSEHLFDFTRYLDRNFGFFHHSYDEKISEYAPLHAVEINVDAGYESGWGRTFMTEAATKSAFLESLERYCNSRNRRYKKLIRGCFSDLSKKYNTLNPVDFCLSNKEYRDSSYKFHDFDSEKNYDWIFGKNITTGKICLLPSQLVFYKDFSKSEENERFVYETSNGCALGSSIEEAIFYGILEIIERDNFLLTWYLKEEVKQLSWESLPSRLRIINERLKENNCELKLFNITKEVGIPVIWALYINHNENASIRSFSAAGCHINPLSAIESAIFEVITSVPTFERLIEVRSKESFIEEIQNNFSLIRDIDDHILYHAHADYKNKMPFLFKNNYGEYQNEFDENRIFNTYSHATLTSDLQALIKIIEKKFGDIYVVNISDKVSEKFGLYCVKVLIPGLLNMSFGHSNRRVNIERIKNYVDYRGGNVNSITLNSINHLPHPFP